MPTVLSTDPYDGATRVETDDNVTIQFSLPMDKPSVINNISFTTGVLPVPNTNSWSSSMRVILNPDKDLEEDTTYTVAIGPEAESEAGTPMGLEYVFSFKTLPIYVPPDPSQIITISGTVRQVSPPPGDPVGTPYEGAEVSMHTVDVPETYTTDSSGEYTHNQIPIDLNEYFVVDPGDNDILTTNSRFMEFSTADSGKVLDFPLLSEVGMQAYGVLCGMAADDVNLNDAQIVGSVLSGVTPEPGAAVSIESGQTVYYIDNDHAGCSSTGATANEDGGLQFIIFNTCPSTVEQGEADITVTGGGCSETVVTIPVKSGELTYVEVICE